MSHSCKVIARPATKPRRHNNDVRHRQSCLSWLLSQRDEHRGYAVINNLQFVEALFAIMASCCAIITFIQANKLQSSIRATLIVLAAVLASTAVLGMSISAVTYSIGKLL